MKRVERKVIDNVSQGVEGYRSSKTSKAEIPSPSKRSLSDRK